MELGKTSSAMYPFTRQLISFKSNNFNEKLAMLILDVKGNYYKEVLKYANEANRLDDIILIELGGFYKYNPLDKPNLKPIVLAHRLKTILNLFNPVSSESYWLDKAEQILAECIKLCRLYNNGYVTFTELHKLIMFEEYYTEKIKIVRELFVSGKLSKEKIYDLLSCINFFEKEFFCLDDRTLSILKSEISRITNIFVSDYTVSSTFCPKEEEINFKGFSEVLEKGKVVVLNMNIAEYRNLSKIIATYLKLDFQTEVMSKLGKNVPIRKNSFISDEFHEYVTSTDSDFFAQSREAKCINIVATQSYTSIQNTIKDEATTKVILQNLINKLWFRTDDIFTIEEAQKQIGKEDKEKISTTISENAKETNFNFITNSLVSKDSSLSESYNKYTQNDYIYETNFFSQNLKTFEALAFLSNGFNILKPEKIIMIPYFKQKEEP
ncbi:MAG: TraM recognition domain-containing protein [Clostridia bacterium]|nr:TraM recognition domain-containing protein [Clostridia bacterium]